MRSPNIADVEWRLHRARIHSDALGDVVDAYRARDPYILHADARADGRTHYLLEIREQPPAEASLILGDALHNLRAALDNLVMALACESTGRPLSDEEARFLQFPILRTKVTRDEFLSKTTRKNGTLQFVGQPYLDRIEEVQPHNWERFIGIGGPDHGHPGPLRLLNDLSNRDKHRRLSLLALSLDAGHLTLGLAEGSPPPIVRFHPPGPLRDGDVVFTRRSEAVVTDVHAELACTIELPDYCHPAPIDAILHSALLWLVEYRVIPHVLGNEETVGHVAHSPFGPPGP